MEHLNASFGQALALLAKIRLSSRALLRPNTLDYFEHWLITDIKFYNIWQFSSSLWQNKLECLLLTLFFVG